jgi:hypothetical protein
MAVIGARLSLSHLALVAATFAEMRDRHVNDS